MSLFCFYVSTACKISQKNNKQILRNTGYRRTYRLNSLVVWLMRSHFHLDLVLCVFYLYIDQKMVLHHISNIETFEKS